MYHLYHTPAFVLASAPFGEANKRFTLLTHELGLVFASATSVREERSKLRYGLQDFSYSDVTLVHGKEFWRLTRAEPRFSVATELRGRISALRMFGRIFKLLERLLAGEEKNEPLFDVVREAAVFLKSPIPPFLKEVSPTCSEKWGTGVISPNKGSTVVFDRRGVTSLTAPTTPSFGHPSSGRRGSFLPSRLAEAASAKRVEKGEFGLGVLVKVEIVLVLRILYLLGYLAPRGEFEMLFHPPFLLDEEALSLAHRFRTLAVSSINHSLRATQL